MKNRRLGAHVSIAGSLGRAIQQAEEIGANTIQIFSASPRMWRAAPLKADEVKAFRRERERLDIQPLVIHCAYLINLAAADPALHAKSVAGMRGELERAIALDADYLVAHPGSGKGASVAEALERVAAGIGEAAQGLRPGRLQFLWENTAGQGQVLGSRPGELEELAAQTAAAADLAVGYCLDTAHCFAAGIDLFEAVAALGAARIGVIHANDSQAAFGSRMAWLAHRSGITQTETKGRAHMAHHLQRISLRKTWRRLSNAYRFLRGLPLISGDDLHPEGIR